ncbi:VOC family protein [Allobranchiibius sp. CTAmp26]|uniref:VOC family protein n=1 Tax=Allobranchiibius sp. CTAmp26 TaxID=2815214 RepID=UPI001AA153D8|nr:VOC family protein [Allobranchiibius sp. CTAmp26]MBO1755136.1 VOC family protein [Allobranchiibius sp. CTAmp26]
MSTSLNPYLNFQGRAREALEFYASVFGGTPDVVTFSQFHMEVPAGEEENVMHGYLKTQSGFELMGADVPSTMPSSPIGGMTISLSGEGGDDDELSGYWNKLSDGADVGMPLEKAPWGAKFGQLTDKFGVPWLVNIQLDQAGG